MKYVNSYMYIIKNIYEYTANRIHGDSQNANGESPGSLDSSDNLVTVFVNKKKKFTSAPGGTGGFEPPIHGFVSLI